MAVEDFHPPQLPPFIAFKDSKETQKAGGIGKILMNSTEPSIRLSVR